MMCPADGGKIFTGWLNRFVLEADFMLLKGGGSFAERKLGGHGRLDVWFFCLA